jgi:hypothetical protein
MDLVDRYVHEVGQLIPRQIRSDVEAELRSLLTESIEERARAEGGSVDAALAADALRRFGAPGEVAARYATPRYLIGPRLYPAYRTAVTIMVSVVAAVTLGLMLFGWFQHAGGLPVLGTLALAGASVMNSLLLNLGLLTLIFALVERVRASNAAKHRAWSPSSLPPVDDPDRISFLGRMLLLYLIAAVAVLFNVYPQWVAVIVFHNTDVQVYPLLRAEFARYLPWLNLWWALAFVLNLVVIRHGRWRRSTRWAEFALETANAALLAAIIVGPPAFEYDILVKLVLQVFAVIAIIRAAVQLFRLLKGRRAAEPWNAGSAA